MPTFFSSNEIQNTLISRLLELAQNDSASVKLRVITQLIRLAEKFNSEILWEEIIKLAHSILKSLPSSAPQPIAWFPSLISHSPPDSATRQELLSLLQGTQNTSPAHLSEQMDGLLLAISHCQDTALNAIFFTHLLKIIAQGGDTILPIFADTLNSNIQSCKNKATLKALIPLFTEYLSRELPYLCLSTYLVNSIPLIWQASDEEQRAKITIALHSLFMTKKSGYAEILFEKMLKFSDPSLRKVILNLSRITLASGRPNFTTRFQTNGFSIEIVQEVTQQFTRTIAAAKLSLQNVTRVVADVGSNTSLSTPVLALEVCDATVERLRSTLANALPNLIQAITVEEYGDISAIIQLLSENMTENFARMLPQLFAVAPEILGLYHILTDSIEKVLDKGALGVALHAHDFAGSIPKAMVDCRSLLRRRQLQEYLNRLLAETIGSEDINNALAKNLPGAIVACQDEVLGAQLKGLFMRLFDKTIHPLMDVSSTVYMLAADKRWREDDAKSLRRAIIEGLEETLPQLFCACNEHERRQLITCLDSLVQFDPQSFALAKAIPQTVVACDEGEAQDQLLELLETITMMGEGYTNNILANSLTNALIHCKNDKALFGLIGNIYRIAVHQDASIREAVAKGLAQALPLLYSRQSLPTQVYNECLSFIVILAGDPDKNVRQAILDGLPAMITSCSHEEQRRKLIAFFQDTLQSLDPASPISFTFFHQMNKAIKMQDPVKGLHDLNFFTETLRKFAVQVPLEREVDLIASKANECIEVEYGNNPAKPG